MRLFKGIKIVNPKQSSFMTPRGGTISAFLITKNFGFIWMVKDKDEVKEND